MTPEGRDLVKFVTFFWRLGGSGDIYNSISMPNYCDVPYRDLGTCTKKGISASAKVWCVSYPVQASNTAPEDRDLEAFLGSGRGGDI